MQISKMFRQMELNVNSPPFFIISQGFMANHALPTLGVYFREVVDVCQPFCWYR